MTHDLAPLRVAVVGAGPAGIFTAQLLRHDAPDTQVDIFERLPVPFGLVRYGVAPDHPRIKGVVDTLHEVLDRRDVRLVAGIEVGTDVSVSRLRAAYDAVIFATGADRDAPLALPGIELPRSFGAAEFVSWYNAHPEAPTAWPLDAEHVGVIGAGNVALDVARMLAKHPRELTATEIPDHVAEALAASRITDVHVFARRGPAEAQFTPLELRDLGELSDVDIVVDPADVVLARSSEALVRSSHQRSIVVRTIQEWAGRDPSTFTASRRIHLHFMQAPVSVEGDGRVEALTLERTRHLVNGAVEGTGELRRHPLGQLYRAIGYASRPIPGVPFDAARRTIPHDTGRVIGNDGAPVPGLYVSGWIKRGPTGLIGSTKMDAQQTVTQLLDDLAPGRVRRVGSDPLPALLEEIGRPGIDWSGWLRVDEHERALGEEQGRARVKVHSLADLTAIALEAHVTN
ncbi:FAD-dependent oxidoreductase [Homoserinibacter gongjuensis]|uniref:ferredoxin--NADP(+) reductase n=1 Tax=Homoserinibacter gongjuensis TaxID=1162968 RepID=A0ABQ6JZP2_9MICO|nr:FAD-dependent oxidoreductase [Homoserinibacter gongjuensis]GMA92823.1 pyridine nucleotide-disulfide oxidoreductase [Homoserinibacter gongjuensis]